MAGRPVHESKHRLVLDAYARTGNLSAAAKEADVDRATARKIVRRAGLEAMRVVRSEDGGLVSPGAVSESPPDATLPPIVLECLRERRKAEPAKPAADVPRDDEYTENGDTAKLVVSSPKRIRTLEDALAFAEVDLTVWRVEKWGCTSWETNMKVRSFDGGKVVKETPHRTHQWRVFFDLKRILPKPFHDATAALVEAMKGHGPKYPPIPRRATPADPHLLEIDIFDAHFGKLCWAPEVSGESYDLRIAETVYRNAVEDLLNMAGGFSIDRILFPIGSDFYHVDTMTNTTTAGTPQDADGRYAKIIEAGERAVLWAIEYLAAVAPVDVIWIPGNHDRIASYHLARTVAAWFRSADHVAVDCGPKVRKYARYGKSLIGYTHGNLEKHSSLPTIMATERPTDWAETTCREWRVGHLHKSKKMETTPVDQHDGVVVRTLRSLSATDYWHFSKGFVGGTRAAEAYLMSFKDGYAGHFMANARASK